MFDIESAYQQSLDYLYSFVDYSLTHNLRFSPEKFDLNRMELFLKRLGDPHKFRPVIHVAGTKGKGSTAVMIASVLQANGYRTGFYTSPHLQEYTERIQVNGEPISKADLVDLVEYVKPTINEFEHLSTFEITTALAFLYYARQKVDVSVIEVGLGGRLDATNVVSPLVSVITSLSMDHMAVLGKTLEKIAFEKAGIIKPGRPVILAPQVDEARRVVEKMAAERQARLIQVGRDYQFLSLAHSLEKQTLAVWPASERARQESSERLEITIPLLGYHQVQNCATAYAALQVARQEGLSVSTEAILKGMAAVCWPGRFEILSRQPLLVVDSAHNPDSAAKLKFAIDDYLADRPVVLIFGASEDKDVVGMYKELLPRVRQVVATQSIHPRAMDANKLVELAYPFGKPAQAVLPVESALKKALELAGPDNAVVVAGSLFVAAAVREVWQRIK
ncbi:MAG TPA: folylpolyglutamate synthase/dihydrofolate synthase family protein [Anaerolineaceae bacterium]|nr:folylpolyglutamate synthase/dihydrofolate synthase family protein [Anaerolineaceae bacterium]